LEHFCRWKTLLKALFDSFSVWKKRFATFRKKQSFEN